MARKRSVVWRFFKTGPGSVQCVLCKNILGKREQGTTTAMLRHLRAKHPTTLGLKPGEGRGARGVSTGRAVVMEADSEHFCSVEVSLEDGETMTIPADTKAEINSTMNVDLEAEHGAPVEQMLVDMSIPPPVKTKRNLRSMIWKYFVRSDCGSSARCLICKESLQYFESTSNLHRHVSKKHPEVSLRAANQKKPLLSSTFSDPPANTSKELNAPEGTERTDFSDSPEVEVTLEEGVAVNETAMSSDINGIMASVQGYVVEQAEGDPRGQPVSRTKPNSQTWLWRHFEHLKSLDAARCRICYKKLECFDGRTSNLQRHMLKRHPEVCLQTNSVLKPLPSNSSQGSNKSTAPSTVQRKASDVIRATLSGEDRRVFKRERELIEALRRVQKEEAQALEHQRELLEKLRSAYTRDAAAEKDQIELLRKAQQEEAKDLLRQREELETERAELQKEQEELQQEKAELLLFHREHLDSCSCSKLTVDGEV